MENKSIDQLLESLNALVGDARGSLFGQDKIMVDRAELLDIVDAIQNQMPQELVKAKAIIDSCNELRTNAKRDAAETRKKADAILDDAELRAAQLVEEDTITKIATKNAEEIVAEAEMKRAELIRGAMEYADRILEEAEASVHTVYDTLCAGVDVLKKRAEAEKDSAALQISEARTAIKNAAANMQNI